MDETPEEIEEWLDDVVSYGIWVAHMVRQDDCCLVLKVVVGEECQRTLRRCSPYTYILHLAPP